MKLVFLGPPGAGKGTQARLLAAERRWPHVATGDMLREAIAQGTAMGREAKGYMDRGELVPDEVVTGIVEERLGRSDCEPGFILDGFPRTRAQAEALDGLLARRDWGLDRVVYFHVDTDEVVRRNTARLICAGCGEVYNLAARPPRVGGRCDACGGELYQRTDDLADTVRKRTAVYQDKSDPVRHYYAQRGVLKRVDALGAIDEVARRVAEALR